ncbi:MAG: hypothetical protein AB8E82_10330 [Aureispira sp.]
MKQNTTAQKWLLGLLIFQVVVASSLAVFAWLDFPSLLEQFGTQHQPDMGILRLLMIYNLCLSLGICALGARWIRQGNKAGIQVGLLVGVLMFTVSITVFVQFGRLDVLLFDGIRALLKVVFGYSALRAFND